MCTSDDVERAARFPAWLCRSLLAATAVAGAGLVSLSCSTVECGEGTVQRDDACIPADGASPETNSCGPGTVYSEGDGACIPEFEPTECGDNTVQEVGQDGQIICVGVGGGTCDQPIACSQPDASKTTVCGQIVDTETGEPVREGDGTDTSNCVVDSPAADGPCAMELGVYDALQIATNPADATPVAADEVVIDKCGRYRVGNAAVPSGGILAITADDNSNGDAEELAWSGFAQYVSPGGRVTGEPLLATRNATDQAWTAAAGDPFGGLTFIEKGAAFVLFFDGATTPSVGVQATRAGDVVAADDYYFSDEAVTRATIDPAADATGTSGSALLVNVGLNQISGVGAEPEGCSWGSDLAASPPGILFYTDRIAVDGEGAACQ